MGLTITGFPAAKATRVSPRHEKCQGKIVAPKQRRDPKDAGMERMSGLGAGWRSDRRVDARTHPGTFFDDLRNKLS